MCSNTLEFLIVDSGPIIKGHCRNFSLISRNIVTIGILNYIKIQY
jgi:hypothetical protein